MIKYRIIENNNIDDSEFYLRNRYKKVVIDGDHTKAEYDSLLQQIMLTNSNYIKALQWSEWINIWYMEYFKKLWDHRNEFITKSYNAERLANLNLSIAGMYNKLKNKKLLTLNDMPSEDVINYSEIKTNPVKKHDAFVNIEFIVEWAEWSQPINEWSFVFSGLNDGNDYLTKNNWKYPTSDESYYFGLDVKPYARIEDISIGGNLIKLIPDDHYLYIKDIFGSKEYYKEQWNHRLVNSGKLRKFPSLPLIIPFNVSEDIQNITDEYGNVTQTLNYFATEFKHKVGSNNTTMLFKDHQYFFNNNNGRDSYYHKFYNKIFGEDRIAMIGDPGNSIFFLRYLNKLTKLDRPPYEKIIYDWWRHVDEYAFITKERVFRHPDMPANIDYTNDSRNTQPIVDESLKQDIRNLTYVRPYLTKFNMYKLAVSMDAKFISDELRIIFPNWENISKPFHDETKPNEMQHQMLTALIAWSRPDGTTYRRLLNNKLYVSDWFEPEKYNVGEYKNTNNDREILGYDWKKEFLKGRKGLTITNDDSWSIPSNIPMDQVLSTRLNDDDTFLGINVFVWLTDRFYPYNRDTEIMKESRLSAMGSIYSKENYFNFPSRIPLSKIGSNWNFNESLVWMNHRSADQPSDQLNDLKISEYLKVNNELRTGDFRKEYSKQQISQNQDPRWIQEINNNWNEDFVPNDGMFKQFLNILNLVYRG